MKAGLARLHQSLDYAGLLPSGHPIVKIPHSKPNAPKTKSLRSGELLVLFSEAADCLS